MVKKILKWAGICLAVVLLAIVALVGWLTVTEFRPEAVEPLAVQPADSGDAATIAVGDSLTVLSQNTGYAGLGQGADFFMDGGSTVKPTRQESVEENLPGLSSQIAGYPADVYFLQEVDTDSSRSYGVDQSQTYRESLGGEYDSVHALNYSCNFVPYPLPPIGTVHSGLQTLSRFSIGSAQRIALPCPFQWPVSAANLKRCLLVSYIPLKDSGKQLVLVNLHLEAYDDGEGKEAQTKMLMDFLTDEYEKGNYVIAGGDFNQTFPGALEEFSIHNTEFWTPGVLENEILPTGWQFACDLDTPSCRLLNEPYNPESENTQFYVIDGFILSPNVALERVETLDMQFVYSDHNPVMVQVTLLEQENS